MTSPDIEDDIENPLVEGDSEYTVRLIVKVNAFDPAHARDRFIQQVNEYGLNNWTYRVSTDTDQEFLVQGYDVLTPEEFAERSEAEGALAVLLEEHVEAALDGENDIAEDGPEDAPVEDVVDPDARV